MANENCQSGNTRGRFGNTRGRFYCVYEEDLLESLRKDIYENNTKGKIEAYARALGEEFVRYYDRSNSTVYREYTENTRTQRSGSKGIENPNENRGRNQRGRTSENSQTDIAPVKETSSTDGVFFDGKNVNTKFSLSDGTRIHNCLTGNTRGRFSVTQGTVLLC